MANRAMATTATNTPSTAMTKPTTKEAATRAGAQTAKAALGAGLRWLRPRLPLAALTVAGAAVAYALKAFFSGANADDLAWVLGPTCWVAGALGGITFTHEAGAGYISHDQQLVVGTACSGLNFLIACFATLFFSFVHRPRRTLARAAWLPASLMLAWLATVATNALRVMLAGPLYHAEIYTAFMTPLRVHRLMGTIVYCTSLFVVHALAMRAWKALGSSPRWTTDGGTKRDWRRSARWLRSPVVFYLGIALAVPLARRGLHGVDAHVLEHAGTVVGTVILLIGLGAIAKALANRIHWNLPHK